MHHGNSEKEHPEEKCQENRPPGQTHSPPRVQAGRPESGAEGRRPQACEEKGRQARRRPQARAQAIPPPGRPKTGRLEKGREGSHCQEEAGRGRYAAAAEAPAPIQIPIRKGKPARPFRKDELAFFRAQLQKQLDLIQGNLNALASDNLKRSPIEATGDISAHSTHMADQGTDNFDRELALNLASSRQDSIYDIEDAIRRIDDGTYGACEVCGSGIERARLKALPFAKKCMHCQNAAERGRTFYRPFSGTLPLQQLAADDAAAESPDSVN